MPFNKKIHLVGSIPLSSTSEVFHTIPSSLPQLLTRIPDGETGVRGNFIMWQTEVFADCQWVMPPFLRSKPLGPVSEKDGIKLRGTGYNTRAIESYQLFCQARKDSLIPTGVKFQVGLPTPINVIASFVLPQYQVEVEKLYEAALLSSLQNIQDAIPKEDLSIQWDLPIEFAFLEFAKLEGKQEWVVAPYDAFLSKSWFGDVEKQVLERIVKLCEHVDDGVEMGFHFCYGDFTHKHFIEPTSTATMVCFANALSLSLSRTINYIHMPVPKSAISLAFFAPLKDLKLDEKTEIHLGLVHSNDLDGTKGRIEVAEKYVENFFGASTECGCGRTAKEDFDSILDICRTICY